MKTSTQTIVSACPHDCPDSCSLLLSVEEGRVVAVRGNPKHPLTDGVLCTKVSRYAERLYHPERLLRPKKRIGNKGEGRFVDISWDEALTEIAARLSAIAADDPEAILPYSYAGTMGLIQRESIAGRFFHLLGASRLKRTVCSAAGSEALKRSLGAGVGILPQAFAESRLIVIWGSNPVVSNLHFWRIASAAKAKGCKLICIDPRKSETAEHCDVHLAIRPGGDLALALAIAHLWQREGHLDHDYLTRYTTGSERLLAAAGNYPPEVAAAITGLEAEAIIDLARTMALTKPMAIRSNYGVQRVHSGGNAVRAIAALPSLIGAWRHVGGGFLLSSSGFYPVDQAAIERPDLCPHYPDLPRELNMSQIGDILCGQHPATRSKPVRALVVYNANPLSIAPDSRRVEAGLARSDLLTVVLEHFQTDTADYADFLLPATMFAEHHDIYRSYGHADILWHGPAVAPAGECKANSQIFRELATHMGMTHPALFESDEAIAEQAFRRDHPHLADDLWSRLHRDGFAALDIAARPFAEGGFPTADGRAVLADDDFDATCSNYESSESDPELARRYPLALISPPSRHMLNSTFANLATLTRNEPTVEIHRDDAAARSINQGDLVRLFNDRGHYIARADITSQRARPGVVNALGLWWRKTLLAKGMASDGVNGLSHQRLTDLGDGPCFYDCLIEVARV